MLMVHTAFSTFSTIINLFFLTSEEPLKSFPSHGEPPLSQLKPYLLGVSEKNAPYIGLPMGIMPPLQWRSGCHPYKQI